MPRNVEIKARAHDVDVLEHRVRELARQRGDSEDPEGLHQRDTFFRIPNGRLKLREIEPEGEPEAARAELIFYRRPDATGPMTSHYRKVDVRDPDGLRALLTEALGVTGRVTKTRRIWLLGRTRVHLDQVQRLGDFLELEVVLADGETEVEGAAVARALMGELGVAEGDLVVGAYVDLRA